MMTMMMMMMMMMTMIMAMTMMLAASAVAADVDAVQYVTDGFGAEAAFTVDVYRGNRVGPFNPSIVPDGCYTSIFQYTEDAQKSVTKKRSSWAGYGFTETHQYVFTGSDSVAESGIWLYIRINDSAFNDTETFQISYLGSLDGETATVEYVSRAQMWGGSGLHIPLYEINRVWPTDEPGRYYRNGLHVVVTPLDDRFQFLGYGALVIFVGATPVPSSGDDCEMVSDQWCNNGLDDEICCYLKADEASGFTLYAPPGDDYEYGWMSGRNGSDAFACFQDDSRITLPYDAGDGVYASSLNNLVYSFTRSSGTSYCEKEGICNLRIVIDPRTTLNFPLSNRFAGGSTPYQVGATLSQTAS